MPDSPATSTTIDQRETRRPFVLVTGLSGAGRGTALAALEDMGYVAVDNVPLPLLGDLMRSTAGSPGELAAPIAFGIDTRTYGFDAHDLARLKQVLLGHFALGAAAGMRIAVMSFSYRRGVPREADLVFDVRFLKNPHYVPNLKPLTGRESEVGAYIAEDPAYAPFFAQLAALLKGLLPGYRREGKSYLTIAIG